MFCTATTQVLFWISLTADMQPAQQTADRTAKHIDSDGLAHGTEQFAGHEACEGQITTRLFIEVTQDSGRTRRPMEHQNFSAVASQ